MEMETNNFHKLKGDFCNLLCQLYYAVLEAQIQVRLVSQDKPVSQL